MNEPVSLAGLRPAGIVFDCDGLLVDTEPCWTVAESAAYAARGLSYGVEQKKMFLGVSAPDSVAMMARIFGEEGNEPAIMAEMLTLVTEAIVAQADAMPGALDLVDRLSGKLPMAVASNSPRQIVELALGRAGLADRFAGIVAVDEVAEAKPAPDLYLSACRMLEVDPARALAFEDSATGVVSARAAGMKVVGVPTLPAHELGADLVVSSLADPALQDWARCI